MPKMTKAQKKALLEQQAAERKRLLEEEKAAEAANKRTAYKQLITSMKKQDDEEQEIRDTVLKNIVQQFSDSTNMKKRLETQIREKEEWVVYMRTDGSPDPRQAPELSAALFRWREEVPEDNDFLLTQDRDVAIQPLLAVLNDVMKYPQGYTDTQLEILFEVREELNVEWIRTLEACTRAWATLPGPRAPPRAERHAHSACAHSLASWIYPPGPPKMVREHEAPTEPEEIEFSDLGVTLTLPGRNCWRGVVLRVLWLMGDLLSPRNRLYKDPDKIPNTRGNNLYEYSSMQYNQVVNIRESQAKARSAFFAEVKARMEQLNKLIADDKYGVLKAERIELVELKIADPEPVVLPRDGLFQDEEDEFAETMGKLRVQADGDLVNLRKYRLCGGLLHIELLQQPPRPKTMKRDIILKTMEAQEALRPVLFREEYIPPPPPAPGATRLPEEIEADIRRQEAALEKLILVHINLPETVLWLEPPLVCCWQEERGAWSTADVHDLKYNEDKFTLTFRIGVINPIGFATLKYSNLPYQGWELKPNASRDGVVVTIMGAIIVLEVEVLSSGIKVKSIQNGATKALQNMVCKTFTLKELINRLQAGGVDMFPTEDAPILVEGSCPKLPVMEEHLYHCMAHCCTAYNFQWSRWNVSAGRRAVVQQVREYLLSDIETFEILHVTPLRATLVEATEVSAEYSTDPIPDLAFYPDVYSLIAGHGGEEAKEILSQISWELVENVKDLLWAVKPCSFS